MQYQCPLPRDRLRADGGGPIVFAVTNQMGGAGKTTTALNLAGAMNDLGLSTLAIDADPQGTLTEGVGLADLFPADVDSLFDVLTNVDRTGDLGSLVRDSSHDDLSGEFDVIPANIEMLRMGRELRDVPQTERRLEMALNKMPADHDVVVIDSPPQYGPISDNCIMASRNLVVPAQAKRRSVRALEILDEQIVRLQSGYDTTIGRHAIVANEVGEPADNDEKEMLTFLQSLKKWGPTTVVPERVAIRRAWNNGCSVFQHDDPAKIEDVRDTYRALARDLLEATGYEVVADV